MDITLRIPELVHAHELRSHVNKASVNNAARRTVRCAEPSFKAVTCSVQMPLLNSKFLQKHRELRLAHLALSMMTMGYVWQEGENNTVEVTPRWCEVFSVPTINIHLCLSYSDAAL